MKLDRQAAGTFCSLIRLMQGNPHLRIENEPFMPLTIERIDENLRLSAVRMDVYSLCHYYIQHGDLMQDPEMCFLVSVNGTGDPGPDTLEIIPFMFQQANIGAYEESMVRRGDTIRMVDPLMQQEQTVFANQWLHNIQRMGFPSENRTLIRL